MIRDQLELFCARLLTVLMLTVGVLLLYGAIWFADLGGTGYVGAIPCIYFGAWLTVHGFARVLADLLDSWIEIRDYAKERLS